MFIFVLLLRAFSLRLSLTLSVCLSRSLNDPFALELQLELFAAFQLLFNFRNATRIAVASSLSLPRTRLSCLQNEVAVAQFSSTQLSSLRSLLAFNCAN